jgi:pseudouridylate synthase
VAWQSDEVAGFYSRSSGHRAPLRADSAAEVAAIIRLQQDIGLAAGVLVTVPLPAELALSREEIGAAVERAEREAALAGIHGPASTPFVLGRVAEITAGRSVTANIALIRQDAAVGGAIAVALAGLSREAT